ncbi:MAG: hypothetical protein LBR36_08325 [Bacteroidales bacterium]|nr:hypothetical protein [Bacteroidales bacterium]
MKKSKLLLLYLVQRFNFHSRRSNAVRPAGKKISSVFQTVVGMLSNTADCDRRLGKYCPCRMGNGQNFSKF